MLTHIRFPAVKLSMALLLSGLLASLSSAPVLAQGGSNGTESSNRPYVLPSTKGPLLSRGAADKSAIPAREVSPASAGSVSNPSNLPQQAGPSTETRIPVNPPSAEPQPAPYEGRQAETPIPLLPPDDPTLTQPPPSSPAGALWTMFTSLVVVLGLFFGVVMLSRRGSPGGPPPLPKEAFEVLGRAPLAGRQQAQIIRFGDKLILLSVSASGVDSIAEVTSPEEVDRIASLCQQQQPGSVTQTFRQVLTQFSKEPAPQGFVGEQSPPNAADADDAIREFERLA